MEIIDRNKRHGDEGDIVPFNADSKDVQDEVNRRTARAGYTTKLGEPTYGTKIISTVGWGKTKLNVWPRDKDGNLIGD